MRSEPLPGPDESTAPALALPDWLDALLALPLPALAGNWDVAPESTLTFNGTVDGTFGGGILNLTAQAGTMIFNDLWGSRTPLGNVSLTATNGFTLPEITANSIFARTTGTTPTVPSATGSRPSGLRARSRKSPC